MVLPRKRTPEATMYHPDSMLKIAHDREAYLVREAQICGVPKADRQRRPFSVNAAVLVLCVTILLTAAWLVLA
jgi:hypothetical protein